MYEIGHFIGGKHFAGTSGRTANVFNPATGEVQATVALASDADLNAAVENAKAAQPNWAATNPQRRARVFMKFVQLLNDNMNELAEMLSREHGKTIEDAKGDIVRGLEVCEFVIGIPHLSKSEFTEGAGPNIDMYSIRQAVGIGAGITPFNFPAMIPMWMFAPAIACGNAFILKPSERDPSVPMRLAELMIEAGLPAGILNVVNGDKSAVDAILTHPDISAVSFVGSTPIARYVYGTAAMNGKRAQCFGGAKNHMIIMPDADLDQAANALMGAGYGSAGERCMAISVAVPVGEETANRLIEKLTPMVESLRIGPYTDEKADMGPVVTKEAKERILGLINKGVEEGANLVVDGRDFKLQGYENGISSAAACSTTSRPTWTSTRPKSSALSCQWCAPRLMRKRSTCRCAMNTAMVSRSIPATAMPPATSPRGSISGWSASTFRSRCRSPITPSAAGSPRPSATSTSMARIRSSSGPAPRR